MRFLSFCQGRLLPLFLFRPHYGHVGDRQANIKLIRVVARCLGILASPS